MSIRFGMWPSLVLALSLAAMPHVAPPVFADEAVARGPVTNLPMPRFVSIRAASANARRGPSLNHGVDWEFVRRGLPVEVVAEYGNWRRVRDADGAGGWVHHSLLSGVRTGLVIGEAPVEVRSRPDPASQVRALAEPGVVARLSACDGDWCEIAAEGARGWLPRSRLWGVTESEQFE